VKLDDEHRTSAASRWNQSLAFAEAGGRLRGASQRVEAVGSKSQADFDAYFNFAGHQAATGRWCNVFGRQSIL
jgi:hypothetical protein